MNDFYFWMAVVSVGGVMLLLAIAVMALADREDHLAEMEGVDCGLDIFQ